MTDWLQSLLSGAALRGVTSRRLASVALGTVLLVWLLAFITATQLPEIPVTVLALLIIVLGTSTLHSPQP
jgi:MFS superfamily sulfate permease-like transporter